MRHLFYLHNLPLPDKVAAQKKIMNKIPARLYIYRYTEISKKVTKFLSSCIQGGIQQVRSPRGGGGGGGGEGGSLVGS